MLHGARMLKTPMTSGSLASWGKKSKGDWITVYANSGHTYAVVAGLRWDTSGGPGPRWHKDMRLALRLRGPPLQGLLGRQTPGRSSASRPVSPAGAVNWTG